LFVLTFLLSMYYFDDFSPTCSLYIDAFCHHFNKVFMYV